MPNSEYNYGTSQRNVKREPYLREMYGRTILMFPGWSHDEVCALSIEARRTLYRSAVVATEEIQRCRLKADEARRVFSDLEFDLETGEVLS
jgi:hypothetical protein